MKTTFIYALIDPNTNEVRYIGKANNPEQRLKSHIKEAIKHNRTYKNRWIASLQPLTPILQVLDTIPEDCWQLAEQAWIAHGFEKDWPLTNTTEGGEGGIVEITEEGRQKLSFINKGKEFSIEHRLHISENHADMKGSNNPFYGKRHTEETIIKQSEVKKGKNNPMFGKKRPEHSERMIEYWKNKKNENL